MFDLTTGKYNPFNKPGNVPQHVNVKSNHPPNIIKYLPESISRFINKLSSDKSVFDNSKIKFDAEFNKNISRSKNRKKKIIWFNPPYGGHVSTNIGKSFLDRHFLKSHKLYKMFNQNNVKIMKSLRQSCF